MKEKKKVLHVLASVGFGGAETFAVNQFRNLCDDYIFDFAVQFPCKDDSYESEIRDLGGKIFYTGLFRKSVFGFIRRLREVILNNGPYEAIHIHINEQAGFAAFAAKMAHAKNVICHAHSSNYGQKNLLIKFIMSRSNKILVHFCADHLAACSRPAAEAYFYRKDAEKAALLGNAIFLKKYTREAHDIRESLSISPKDLTILHVGRFINVKNHEFIVEIAKELSRKGNTYKIILVGAGDRLEKIKALVDEAGLEKCFIFTGERQDVNNIMASADVLILPSLFEGVPTVILEAQASSLPCLVSNSVSPECDLGMGLVTFVSIDQEESAKMWADSLIDIKKHKTIDEEIISDVFRKKGYSIDAVSDLLKSLYLSH